MWREDREREVVWFTEWKEVMTVERDQLCDCVELRDV